MKNEIGLNLYVTKAKVNKDGTFEELYINDEKVETSTSVELYAWKNSTDGYIYTKKIPESAGSISIITQNPMDDATAAYVGATPSVTNDIWKIGSTFYESDLTSGTEPSGTAGTPVDLGEVYIATAGDTALEEGVWYTKDTNWYKVTALTTSALVKGEQITDTDAITALENIGGYDVVYYVPYTQAAVDAHISYSSDDYMRDSTKDYTLE